MKRRLLIVVWGSAVLMTLVLQTSLSDPMRALSIDSLIWLRDRLPGQHQPPEEPGVAIVAVDEATYQAPPFRGTPRVAWSNYLADVVDALLDAGAAVIAFDIVLPTSLDTLLPGIDTELLAALHRASRDDRVILGEILHGRARIQPYLGYRAVVNFEQNIRPLDVILDPDGVVRRMPLSLPKRSADGTLGATPSMALELAQRARQHTIGRGSAHLEKQDTDIAGRVPDSGDLAKGSIINLHRHNISVMTYSLADLYHCAKVGERSYLTKHFSDKVVLIGSALDVEDQVLSSARFILPYQEHRLVDSCAPSSRGAFFGSGGPTMPGVYLHAAMVQNLLNNDMIETASPVVHTFLTLLAIGSLMLVGVSLHPVASLPLLGMAGAAMTIGSSVAFAFNFLIFFLIPVAGSIVGYAVGLSLHLLILERRRRRIRDAFNHLLPTSVVEQLIDRNEFPSGGGKLINCTVLLTDLENYTGLAEQLKPEELVDVLNQVNQALGEVIERHGGIVSWHAGDSLLALFGAPIECADHATQGVKAALDCCSVVDRLDVPYLLMHGMTLRVRVGVSTGDILVGYIGSSRHLTYSAIGDHVNIASRLEGLNKVYDTSVLANETTKALAEQEFTWRKVDKTLVKGRKARISVFEPKPLQR